MYVCTAVSGSSSDTATAAAVRSLFAVPVCDLETMFLYLKTAIGHVKEKSVFARNLYVVVSGSSSDAAAVISS